MRIIILLCFTFFVPKIILAQEPAISDSNYQEVLPNEKVEGFSLIDRYPMYPGGKEGIAKDIQKELKYPEKAKQKKIEGKAILRYVVEVDGSIGEVKVLESDNPQFAKEAIRVIKSLKKWKPAIQQGHPVKSAYEQVFHFNLENE